MSQDNPWELYESVHGWEICSAKLNAAMEAVLFSLDGWVKIGSTIPDASNTAARAMERLMSLPSYRDYGAFDTEPRNHMLNLIQKHVQTRYGVEIQL